MENPFEDSAITSILVSSDPLRSKVFYTDVLGAELYREYGSSIVLQFLGHWLLLVESGGPTEDKPDTHLIPPSDPNRLSSCFTIRVKDCRKSYEILKTRGAEFITPPYDWGHELRCFLRDPDGHLFEISEYKG